MKETAGKTANRRKPIPHMCITCQHYAPHHCNLYNGYIEDWDCDVITKCRAWRLSDNYKKGGKFYDMKDEGDKKMKEDKYSVIDDNGKVAEHMTLEVASTLVYALHKKWDKEDVTTIIIAREPVREEAWEDDD